MSEYQDRINKRKDLRIPVRVPLSVRLQGGETVIEFKTEIINYSHGGICINWNLCEVCTGYSFGEIHPDCTFAPYDSDSDSTKTIDFYVEDNKTGEEGHFTGKAVYTFKQGDTEQVGVQFIDMPDRVRNMIKP